ncbi:hypothetical protein [Cucumibacter marinus]|uniref:hypothetical protein n=1 Tax=Cucumibacter marinus TaxID=1121252 RepID=UPI0004257C71|nr:hypothetical protein [Cucumibacter marinus]
MYLPQARLLVLASAMIVGASTAATAQSDLIFRPEKNNSTQPSGGSASPAPAQPASAPTPASNSTKASSSRLATGPWDMRRKCTNTPRQYSVTITSATASAFTGSYGPSEMKNGRINGNQISFNIDYVDWLGKEQRETWVGTFNAGNDTITGTYTGGWASNCNWTMSR